MVGCALQHQRGEVNRRDAGPEAPRDPDRRRANAATHVEDALVGLKISAADQRIGGRPTAGVDDAFA